MRRLAPHAAYAKGGLSQRTLTWRAIAGKCSIQMGAVLKSLGLAFAQLGDPAVLRLLAKTVAITLVIFAVIGVALFQATLAASTYIGMSIGAEAAYLISLVLTLLASWLLFRIVALAVLQFFADEIVIAVELKHYPQAAQTARKLPFREDLANSLRGAGRAVLFNALAAPIALVLFFTAIGPAVVFLLVNAVLLGRELTDMGWLRHRVSPDALSPVGKGERLLLGSAIAALMTVPFLNLVAPIVGAAAGTHLVQIARQRSQ